MTEEVIATKALEVDALDCPIAREDVIFQDRGERSGFGKQTAIGTLSWTLGRGNYPIQGQ
jgi:hypothetical protein